MTTINAESHIAGCVYCEEESHIAGWFCVYCEEDFDTEQLVDLHLAGGNSCSEIDTGRKNMKLVQDPEKKPNHYYVELINPAAAAADEPAAADEHVVSKSNVY